MTHPTSNVRLPSRVITSETAFEGAGFLVHRAFPTRALSDFDPFLLLDEMGPMDLKPGEAKGAPDHPHRGFETVTYMLEGRMNHKDSQGNKGSLGSGDVQWMTAGAGVVHSEMPGPELVQAGGRMHGFQLWVNLPRRDKMMQPRYQDVPSAKIPVVQKDGVQVKVIAGKALGQNAVIDTRIPIFYLHATLDPGAQLVQEIPQDYSVFAYVVNGKVQAGGTQPAEQHQIILFDNKGDQISLTNASDGIADVLIIAGQPISEPIARYGPFVMNSEDEIQQAIDDYRNGRLGSIKF